MHCSIKKWKLSTQKRLVIVIAVSFGFVLGELGVGFTTNSLALIADAFHYIGDILSFAVALLAERYSTCPVKNCEGTYDTLPELAAFFNSVFLVALGLGIFLQGVERFVHPQAITNPKLVLAMGSIGLFLNIVCVFVMGTHFHHSHSHNQKEQHNARHPQIVISNDVENTSSPAETTMRTNLSIKAVLLHIAADALNNLAVIISAVVMWKVSASSAELEADGVRGPKLYVDPTCTVFIAILIMGTTCPLVMRSGRKLLGIKKEGRSLSSSSLPVSVVVNAGTLESRSQGSWNYRVSEIVS